MTVTTSEWEKLSKTMNRTRYFNPKFTSNIFLYQTIYEFANGQKYLNWNPFLQSLVLEK